MKYSIGLCVLLLCIGVGPVFAELPYPPPGATPIGFNPGLPSGSGYARIYIWYDSSGSLYLRVEPVNGFNLLYAAPEYMKDLYPYDTDINNEYGFDDWSTIYEPQTFYLHATEAGESFPSVFETAQLRFTSAVGAHTFASWPADFNAGQVYPESCNCPSSSGEPRVVVVPLFLDDSARSREDQELSRVFLDSSQELGD